MQTIPLQKSLDTMKQVIKEVNELNRLNTDYEKETQAMIKKLMDEAKSLADQVFNRLAVGAAGGVAGLAGFAFNLTNPVGWAIIGATVVSAVTSALDKQNELNKTKKEICNCEVQVKKIQKQSDIILELLQNLKDKDQELQNLSQTLQNKQTRLQKFACGVLVSMYGAIFDVNLQLFNSAWETATDTFRQFELARGESIAICMDISKLLTKRINQLEVAKTMTQNTLNQYQQGTRVKSQDELYAQMTYQPSTQSILDYLNNI